MLLLIKKYGPSQKRQFIKEFNDNECYTSFATDHKNAKVILKSMQIKIIVE